MKINAALHRPSLTLRLFLNILFWLLYFAVDIGSLSTQLHAGGKNSLHYTSFADTFLSLPASHYLLLLLKLALTAVVLYTNNLLLVPRLLKAKRYLLYTCTTLLLLGSMSLASTAIFNAIQHLHPALPVHDIVFGNFIASKSPRPALQFLIAYSQLLIVFTMLWYIYDHAAQRRRLAMVEHQQVQTELSFLKAQINPHFLFNNLNNLYALAIKQSADTPAAILQLSALLRYVLYESNAPLVPFSKEHEAIEAYIKLERLRMQDDGDLHITIAADEAYNIPPLLWMPMLENMFKYGVHAVDGGQYGQFSFTIQNHRLRIHTRNRYIPAQHTAAGGIGLHNLQKRLQLLYPGQYELGHGVEGDEYIANLSITPA